MLRMNHLIVVQAILKQTFLFAQLSSTYKSKMPYCQLAYLTYAAHGGFLSSKLNYIGGKEPSSEKFVWTKYTLDALIQVVCRFSCVKDSNWQLGVFASSADFCISYLLVLFSDANGKHALLGFARTHPFFLPIWIIRHSLVAGFACTYSCTLLPMLISDKDHLELSFWSCSVIVYISLFVFTVLFFLFDVLEHRAEISLVISRAGKWTNLGILSYDDLNTMMKERGQTCRIQFYDVDQVFCRGDVALLPLGQASRSELQAWELRSAVAVGQTSVMECRVSETKYQSGGVTDSRTVQLIPGLPSALADFMVDAFGNERMLDMSSSPLVAAALGGLASTAVLAAALALTQSKSESFLLIAGATLASEEMLRVLVWSDSPMDQTFKFIARVRKTLLTRVGLTGGLRQLGLTRGPAFHPVDEGVVQATKHRIRRDTGIDKAVLSCVLGRRLHVEESEGRYSSITHAGVNANVSRSQRINVGANTEKISGGKNTSASSNKKKR